MNSVEAEHESAIAEQYQSYQMERLDLFGSGDSTEFDPQTSDLDFTLGYSRNANPDTRFI